MRLTLQYRNKETNMRKRHIVTILAFLACLGSSNAWAASVSDIRVAGTYTLSADQDHEIRISAGNVTLDCGGHKVWSALNAPVCPLEVDNKNLERNGIWIKSYQDNTPIEN